MEIGAKIATLGHVQNEHSEKKGNKRKRKMKQIQKVREGMRIYEKAHTGV